MANGVAITIDTSGVEPLRRGLDGAQKALAADHAGRLGAAANRGADGLVVALRSAAQSAATPQARIVAESLDVQRGGDVGVMIGGARPVGRRGTSAGVLLWGSEHGGRNFDAPAGGAYWIAPTADQYAAGTAERLYLDAVTAILHDWRLN